jgi:hypothetical protein
MMFRSQARKAWKGLPEPKPGEDSLDLCMAVSAQLVHKINRYNGVGRQYHPPQSGPLSTGVSSFGNRPCEQQMTGGR